MNRFSLILIIFSSLQLIVLNGQVVLNADGPGDTYELINSVLAPGYDVVEVPDCAHPEFGRHITEVQDTLLDRYVFAFHIHVTPDNDRCINFDRQRNEIKSYDKSPDSLKAVEGEIVQYNWKFKIDSGFQSSSSFTHLHQLKAVGGTEESMPLITLTARKGTPDKLEIRYAKNTTQSTIYSVPLDSFKGNWVDVEEVVTYGETGKYNLVINRISDSINLLTYNRDNIRMWKTDASFIRPKWGIYRSLNHPEDLRDEIVCFSDFMVEEIGSTLFANSSNIEKALNIYPNPARDYIILNYPAQQIPSRVLITDHVGRTVMSQQAEEGVRFDISALDSGIYFVHLYSNNKIIGISKLLKL